MDDLAFPTRDPGPTIVRVGVDVGQRQDYSAIVITEQERRDELPHFLVRSIERLPLGTPYPLMVDRIAEVMERLEHRSWPRRGPRLFTLELILDATGVGLPIGDMLKERGLHPKLCLFTGSDKITEQPHSITMVGKCWMVSRMQVLLQSRRLHLPRTIEAATLARELRDYQVHVNDHANVSFNAKSGSHDDLVIAAALSCGVTRTAGRASSRSYINEDRDLAGDMADAGRRVRNLPHRR